MSSSEPERLRALGELGPDEATYVSSKLATMFGNHATRVSLESKLGSWRRFVASLEQPYAMSIYDYHRALMDRDEIEELTVGAPPSLRQRLEAAIRPLDARYERLTVEVPNPIQSGHDHWWWLRIPVASGERMRTDLRERGFLV